ncbi:MAG: hypothetical protein CMP14_00095 [Rickettsiales bacterium]|mgnify:CR=1 FL=1|nr:hypothetical protein [Rickettsiales bacterium]
MFLDNYIFSNKEIIISFIGMIAVYFISYYFMKKNKTEAEDIKRTKWMAFGIALVVVGFCRVLIFSD